MAIEKMTLVNIYGKREKLDEVIFGCADADNFHPELTGAYSGRVKGFTPLTEENPYTALLARMKVIGEDAGLDLSATQCEEGRIHPGEVDAFLEDFRSRLLGLGGSRDTIMQAKQNYESAIATLQHLSGLDDVSLDEIFASRFLEVRFGRLPVDGYSKLDYFADRMFIYMEMDRDRDYSWGVYFTTEENAAEVDDIFASLYFERIWIPDFVHGTPEAAVDYLTGEVAAQAEALEDIAERIRGLVRVNGEQFVQVYSQARFLNDYFDLRKYVTVSGDVFHIEGFVPAREADAFVGRLSRIDTVSAETAPEDTDSRLTPPTKLRNNSLVRPFEMFVEMYGLPAYGDMDPTPFLAITFSFLFGIMFGDVGQGALLCILGEYLYRRRKMALGGVMSRIGVVSICFGFVYGSVFGFEELLDPLYHVLGMHGKPIHILDPLSTNFILFSAIGVGAFLILITMLMHIGQSLHRGDIGSALFAQNGLAGLIFYGAVLMTAFDRDMLKAHNMVLFIGIPLIVIFLKEPLSHVISGHGGKLFEDGFVSFAVESFFELFEVLLSFVTNTMSFLRVGGFAMIHAGMMAVVFTLSGMMSGVGNILVIIIGNIFVMGMEGLLSGIQVLRLQYYEMFSRYYEGDGKPFRPIAARE